MYLKKLSILVISSLLSLVLFSALITNLSEMNPDNMFDTIFVDIYENANPKSQNDLMSKFNNNCQIINSKAIEATSSALELCTDISKRKELEKTCETIDTVRKLIPRDELDQLELVCSSLDDLEQQCQQMQDSADVEFDIDALRKVCTEHSTGKTSDAQFFSNMALTLIPNKDEIVDQDIPLFKLMKIVDFIEKYWLFISIALTIILLLLHKENFRYFYMRFGKIFTGIGTMVIIPFIILKVYLTNTPVDTGFILDAVSGGTGFAMKEFMGESLRTLFPIIMLRTFTKELIIASIIILVVGIIIKIVTYEKKHPLNPREQVIKEHLQQVEQDKKRPI